jgi:SAM-dependent methyltransferase
MDPITKVDVACLHCGSTGSDPLWSGHEHEYDNTTDEEFTFVRCRKCSLVRLDPRPDVSELGRIYPPQYYAYGLTTEAAGKTSITDRFKIWWYSSRFKGLVKRLGKQGTIRILDIGCADGRLLDWYKAGPLGDRLATHGIEMDASAAEIARQKGHLVVTGRFEIDTELEKGSFDLMLASHVIEHVDDPLGFAQHAADLLAPGGLFVVATPNWDSPDARRFKSHWGGNHFPRHWTLYDEKSINELADLVGLKVEKIVYQSNPIFWVWTCHSWLRAKFPGRRWPDRLFPPVRIFHPSLQSFVLLSAFTTVDIVQRTFLGRTGTFSVELRKPA